MASSLLNETKVVNPGLTTPCVEPYCKSSLEDVFVKSGTIFPRHTMQSFQLATKQLRNQINLDKAKGSLKRNGFDPPDGLIGLGGDGVYVVCMDRFHDNELLLYDHASKEIKHLGYLPFNQNWGSTNRFGCCVHEPWVLCQITPAGDHVVLFGPLQFAQSHSPKSDAPVLIIYQVSPLKCLYEKDCKKIYFLKCSPVGISVSPPSIQLGQYRVAMVTKEMEVRIWDTGIEQGFSLHLESVSPCLFVQLNNGNPHESCVRFSPDGQLLSVMCYMQDENKCACLILKARDLEPLCWMVADEVYTWLRCIFPMFSACGTEVVLSTYSDSDNEYDLKKFEMLIHKIPLRVQALKFLCRVVILRVVHPCSLKLLPLSKGLITYLTGSRIEKEFQEFCSLAVSEKTTTCKCNLM